MAERIESVRVMPLREAPGGGHIGVTRVGALPEWLYTRWMYLTPHSVRSVRIVTDVYPVVLWVFADGSDSPAGIVSVPDARPVRVDGVLRAVEMLGAEFSVRDAAGALVDPAVTRLDVWMDDVPEVRGVFSAPPSGSLRGLRWVYGEAAQVGAVYLESEQYPVTLSLRAQGSARNLRGGTPTKAFIAVAPLPKPC